MDRHEIKCVHKTNRFNPHERIDNIGGVNSNGTLWKLTLDRAIEGIELGKWQFYVNRGGYVVDVVVASHLGHKYLKTRNDGVSPDNLLSLPECPY